MLTFNSILANDPAAVAILRLPVPDAPAAPDFYEAAQHTAEMLELHTDSDVTFKPNATAAERFLEPESGIGVHPSFIHGLIAHLQANGGARRQMVIVEDPLNIDYGQAPTWQGTGYLEIASQTGALLHSPTLADCVERPVRRPHTAPIMRVSRYAVDPRFALLNVPKLKTHNLGLTTLCLKNLMGLVYGPQRHFCSQSMAELPAGCTSQQRERHEWMDEALHACWQMGLARRLADLGQVIRPQLNILEGIIARDGTGFQHGRNHLLRLVIAGVNMVAVDSVASYLMGFDPGELIYLRVAAAAGLGSNRIEDIHCYALEGDHLAPCTALEAYRAEPSLEVTRMIRSKTGAAL